MEGDTSQCRHRLRASVPASCSVFWPRSLSPRPRWHGTGGATVLSSRGFSAQPDVAASWLTGLRCGLLQGESGFTKLRDAAPQDPGLQIPGKETGGYVKTGTRQEGCLEPRELVANASVSLPSLPVQREPWPVARGARKWVQRHGRPFLSVGVEAGSTLPPGSEAAGGLQVVSVPVSCWQEGWGWGVCTLLSGAGVPEHLPGPSPQCFRTA